MKDYNHVWGHIGPFEIVGTSSPSDAVGLRDRTGRWVISPEKGYTSFSHYDDGIIIAFSNHDEIRGWVLLDYHGNPVSERYGFIEPTTEGYYKVERGAKRNIMRRDGSLVLKEWVPRVGNVCGGFFTIGTTIRKTKTTPTKYLSGVAHVSGIIVFPMIFDSISLPQDSKGDMVAKKDGQPYVIHNGALFDPQKRNYPPLGKDGLSSSMIEEMLNWILPGLQFFYRDSLDTFDVEKMYPIGKVLRTGFYATMSTKLLKPRAKTRFLIASAHGALLCSDEEGNPNPKGLEFSPRAEEWRQALLHKNSWLKVLDVYKVGDVTQIFLLQIPETLAKLFGDFDAMFKFINEESGHGTTLVEMARKSLDDKLSQTVHPRSLDHDLAELMYSPLGYDSTGKSYGLEADVMYDAKNIEIGNSKPINEQALSWYIHNNGHDRDIITPYDGFPWQGIPASVCEGCVYANGTNDKPFGCGRLFTGSFRKNYVNGSCDYYKQSLFVESRAEERARWEREKKAKHERETSDVHAINLVKEFVEKYLGGDVDNLVDFNLDQLNNKDFYSSLGRIAGNQIVQAIMVTVFGEYWSGLNIESLNQYKYRIGGIINTQRLVGSRLLDGSFMSLSRFNQDFALKTLAEYLYQKSCTIGNYVVWPNKAQLFNLFDSSKMRGYIDRLFVAMYDVAINGPKQNLDVKNALYSNRKLMENYQGKEGFERFMKDSMLTGFLDKDGIPHIIFKGLSVAAKDFNPKEMPDALKQYHDFMVPLVTERSKQIAETLKGKLSYAN